MPFKSLICGAQYNAQGGVESAKVLTPGSWVGRVGKVPRGEATRQASTHRETDNTQHIHSRPNMPW